MNFSFPMAGIAKLLIETNEAIEAIEMRALRNNDRAWQKALTKPEPWKHLNISRSTFQRWKNLDWEVRARRVRNHHPRALRTSISLADFRRMYQS